MPAIDFIEGGKRFIALAPDEPKVVAEPSAEMLERIAASRRLKEAGRAKAQAKKAGPSAKPAPAAPTKSAPRSLTDLKVRRPESGRSNKKGPALLPREDRRGVVGPGQGLSRLASIDADRRADHALYMEREAAEDRILDEQGTCPTAQDQLAG